MTETPTAEQHPAAAFNIDAWLQDAAMPEESADVFKRADVVGELSALRRQIDLQQEAAAVERTAGDTDTFAELDARYQQLLDTFVGSQLTVYCRALGPDERRALREESEQRTKGKPQEEQNADYGYAVLSASIVAVKPYRGARTPVTWTRDQVRAMENTIGGTQMSAVLDAHRIAQNKMPEVDADFLHKRSGGGTGQA